MIILSICLVSCRKSTVATQINDVESYIQTRPDSALAVLSQIDTASLSSPKLRAHFALLQAMALDKNAIDTTDLRVIRPAVEYYQKHGTARQKMLAYYYEGRILYNARRDAEAFLSQTQALENAKATDAGRYLGLIYASMADLSNRSYCWKEANEYLLKAQNAFLEVKDSISSLHVIRKRVIVLFNQDQNDQVLLTIDSLLYNNNNMPKSLYAEFLSIKAASMVDTVQLDYLPAVDCFKKAIEAGAILTVTQKSRYAYALARSGFNTESDRIFASITESSNKNSAKAGIWIQELLASKHQYESAYWTLRKSLDYQASEVNHVLNQSLFRAQRDFFKAKERESTLRSRNQRLVYLILVLTFIVFTIYLIRIISFLRQKAQSKEIEMERLSEELEKIICEKERSYSDLLNQFRHIHQEQFKLLEQYYKDYEVARRSGAGEKELYERLLAIINDIEGDTDGQRYLDSLIDEQYEGIMQRLYSECPNLTKQDYLLFSYSAAGFKRSTIGMLLGNLSSDAIHTRRSRLRKAIKTINPPSLQDFLTLIDMR